MFTVQKLLELPLFDRAVLVGGAAGIDRSVRHVQVVDVPDPKFQWAEGGELMLTTGYSLPESPEAQRHYIEKLYHLNLAGLVISVGHYMQHIPQPLHEAANRLAFPVIELPSSVSFAHVTREVMGHIIDAQHSLNKRANEIQQTLMNLVLDGQSLQVVADVLAELLGRSITIESRSFEVLATAQVGAVDVARERSVALGQTSPALAEELIQRGIYKKLLEKRGPVYVAPIVDIDMSMERIVAPIIVANQITGFVWIIAGDRRLDTLDNLAIETASLVTALIMLRERDLFRQERTLRGDLFSRLLNNPDPTDSDLVELAHQSGFQVNLKYQAIVLKGRDQDGDTADLDRLHRRVERYFDGRKLVVQREQALVVLLQSHRVPDGSRAAGILYEMLAHPTLRVLLGVGTPAANMTEIRDSFESAMEVIDLMELRGFYSGVYTHDEMGLLLWLKQLSPAMLARNRFYRAVDALYRRDAALYDTLKVYLQQDKNSSATAKELVIHRNTLAYRLQKIERILGYSLEDAEICMNLYVALKAYHLHNH